MHKSIDIKMMDTVKHYKRGGKRKGAGRPKTKEDTKVMRVPVSKVDEVKKLISK